MNIPIIKKPDWVEADYSKEEIRDGILVFHLSMRAKCQEKHDGEVLVSFKEPYTDCTGVWHPRCSLDRAVNPDWCGYLRSMTASSAPVMCLFSADSKNRFTMSVSETKEIIYMRAGLHEEDGNVLLEVKLPADYAYNKEGFETDIRIDTRDIPFYESVEDVSKWWESECKITPAKTPDCAKEPVYSTWYSYHQNLKDTEIEKECELASKLGFKTVILDDGWQTDDNNRGYAFCGDWEVSENRFKDFAEHIKKVHNMSMKYMVWYSVPFVGKESKHWDEFEDKLLSYNGNADIKAGVLDPRYREVREYLVNTYINAIERYGMDGFKLDFIDSIYETAETPPYNPEKMDFESVQEALDCLMLTVKSRLSEKNEDIMIEFRQGYIGPNMRRYGNMFRVGDCPDSALRNRVGVVDLRMTSGNTAVHSDMLMWHKDEKPEIAALQIISSIFATVQISVKLGEITDKMRKMIGFWVKFMAEHVDILQNAPICAAEPHNLYPVVWTKKDDEAIVAVYSENRVLKIPDGAEKCILLNGTKCGSMVIKADCAGEAEVKDCFGDTVSVCYIDEGLNEIDVPCAGQVCWTKE